MVQRRRVVIGMIVAAAGLVSVGCEEKAAPPAKAQPNKAPPAAPATGTTGTTGTNGATGTTSGGH